jgi:hypothetical protein
MDPSLVELRRLLDRVKAEAVAARDAAGTGAALRSVELPYMDSSARAPAPELPAYLRDAPPTPSARAVVVAPPPAAGVIPAPLVADSSSDYLSLLGRSEANSKGRDMEINVVETKRDLDAVYGKMLSEWHERNAEELRPRSKNAPPREPETAVPETVAVSTVGGVHPTCLASGSGAVAALERESETESDDEEADEATIASMGGVEDAEGRRKRELLKALLAARKVEQLQSDIANIMTGNTPEARARAAERVRRKHERHVARQALQREREAEREARKAERAQARLTRHVHEGAE